ncbi:hypothetical protein N7530_005066 [Penicillium desertorum]|uniref:Uncharacterized protein n=1 Tax=Penicillium desertorum TaxID=1303715 RepID=A0A9X0BRC6_9EURO|nr:hypothetical protein N7530_005066 [Penicillium desertorum]
MLYDVTQKVLHQLSSTALNTHVNRIPKSNLPILDTPKRLLAWIGPVHVDCLMNIMFVKYRLLYRRRNRLKANWSALAFVYYLLRHPNYLQRLRDEIDTPQDRDELSPMVQYNEAQRLPFLQACLKEIYRFHSAAVGGLPRVVPQGGMTIAGRYFPEEVVLSINAWVIHRNPQIFGDDCNNYNPNRWLQKKDQLHRLISDLCAHSWGAGYNQYPGGNVAQFELLKLMATLIRDYDIEQVDARKEWVFKSQFTAIPSGWPRKIQRRSRD